MSKTGKKIIGNLIFAVLFTLVSFFFVKFDRVFEFVKYRYSSIEILVLVILSLVFTFLGSRASVKLSGNYSFVSVSSTIIVLLSSLFYVTDHFYKQLYGPDILFTGPHFVYMTIATLSLPFFIKKYFNKQTKQYNGFLNSLFLCYSITLIFFFWQCFIRTPNSVDSINLNIIPFKGTVRFFKYSLKDFSSLFISFGNIFAFIPFAIVLSHFFKNASKWITLIIGFLTPFFIEGYQWIFTCGNVDIDDIILNVFGFLIGYFIYHKLIKMAK